jgi:branched-chain amino acid transport system substrate-binding protein
MFPLLAAAESGVTAKEILLGGSNAATGPVASVCYAVTHGQLAHFKRVNEAGGLHGRKIRYEVLDDAYSAQRAIGNVRRLTQQDDVFALFGGCGTVTAAGILSAVEGTDVPYLFPYAGLDKMIDPVKRNVFALMPLYSEQTAAIVPFAIEKSKPKTAAMFSTTVAGHEAWRQAARERLAAAGVKLVIDSVMEVTSPERATFVVQAKEKDPDLLLIMDTAPNAARFLIEMKRQNWKPRMIAGYSTLTDETFLRAAAENAEGILLAPGIVVPPTAPQAKQCVEELAAYNKDLVPSHFSMFGCLSARVMVEALRRAGPDLTRPKLVSTLEAMKNYDTGLSGKVSFGPSQHMGLTEMYPFGIEKGQFKIVAPPIGTKP